MLIAMSIWQNSEAVLLLREFKRFSSGICARRGGACADETKYGTIPAGKNQGFLLGVSISSLFHNDRPRGAMSILLKESVPTQVFPAGLRSDAKAARVRILARLAFPLPP